MSRSNNFLFSAAKCGFKRSNKPDLALIYSPIPCTFAGVFTKNQVRAACVEENEKLLRRNKKIRAIVINSGNANACTGKKGVQAVKETKKIAANLLTQRSKKQEAGSRKVNPDEVLVASTGVIGVHLNMEKMKKGLESAVPQLSSKNFKKAARAILTTDKFLKIASKKNRYFKLIGFAKGAGMIHPNMATMLCYFMTDLNMPQKYFQECVEEASNHSFNNISVDGDVSTNDMVVLLSSNTSKKRVTSKKDLVYIEFNKALNESCLKLAKDMVKDGEGAKKIINVIVQGAKRVSDAREIARSIASSTLFKCAIFGADPNWGRAAARIGTTSVKINPSKLDISLNNTFVYKNGTPVSFSYEILHKQMKKKKEVVITVNLKLGKYTGQAFGCDLSYDYVKLNSAYFT